MQLQTTCMWLWSRLVVVSSEGCNLSCIVALVILSHTPANSARAHRLRDVFRDIHRREDITHFIWRSYKRDIIYDPWHDISRLWVWTPLNRRGLPRTITRIKTQLLITQPFSGHAVTLPVASAVNLTTFGHRRPRGAWPRGHIFRSFLTKPAAAPWAPRAVLLHPHTRGHLMAFSAVPGNITPVGAGSRRVVTPRSDDLAGTVPEAGGPESWGGGAVADTAGE